MPVRGPTVTRNLNNCSVYLHVSCRHYLSIYPWSRKKANHYYCVHWINVQQIQNNTVCNYLTCMVMYILHAHIHYYLALLRSLLHPCLIDSVHLIHSALNSAGVFKYMGNIVIIWFFRSCISCNGRPGSSLSPVNVHWIITASPKNDSLFMGIKARVTIELS